MITEKHLKLFVALIVIYAILAVSAVLFGTRQNIHPQFGSVTQSNEYHATTTDANFGTLPKLIQTGTGALGSVIIEGATEGANLKIYDATTSNITLRGNTSTSSIQIANFITTSLGGTYTFDIILQYGLLIEAGSGIASTSITYR